MSRGHWMRAVLAVMALSVAACGGASPTAAAPQSTDRGGQEAGNALEAVYAEVGGLEGDERRQRLVELAAEEDGTLTWYTSTNLDESQPVVDAFADDVGLEPELYRASSSDLLQRLLQEAQAGYAGADVVATNGPEMSALDQQGLLLPLESPLKDDINEVAVFDNWVGFYLNVFTAAWNTDLLSEGEYPKTWEDGVAIHRDTDAPAQSLLFVEYLLSDAQAMLAEFDRSPANTMYGGVPEGYETITVDLEEMLDQREKWEGLYEEVVRESGKEVVAD